ncbi:MAG TPA: NlpC/P60 family protein [Candidatus Nanoarchaeia archaeon]
MEFFPFNDHCALQLSELRLPMTREKVVEVLAKRGFKELDLGFEAMIEAARDCIGKSEYDRVDPRLAPLVVDCATFLMWVYGQRGVLLPRYPIQQRKMGRPIDLLEVRIGDLLFMRGYRPLYDDDPNNAVGHCGIVTEKGTVVHAANGRVGVIEQPMERFVGGGDGFRGARRIIEDEADVLTFLNTKRRWLRSSDDFRYIILKIPPHKHW